MIDYCWNLDRKRICLRGLGVRDLWRVHGGIVPDPVYFISKAGVLASEAVKSIASEV